MIKVYLPWENLGCLGVRLGNAFYADIYRTPYIGVFIRYKENRYNVSCRGGIRKWR
jgi:hypothetical protein